MAAPVTDLPMGASGAKNLHPDFPTGPHAVSVRALEEDLAALWKSVAEAKDPAGNAAVTRAALFTLVAVVPDEVRAERMAEAVARLTERSPCRAIIVQLNEDGLAQEPLEAMATAHCHRVAGGRQVCCEQVTVRTTPTGDLHLSSLALPLLLPDLPVLLYWPEVALMMSPPKPGPSHLARGAQFLCDLDPFVDQVILDSVLAGDTDLYLSRTLALAERPPGPGMRPIDLNWVRLLPWREALADAVDLCAIAPMSIAIATIETMALPGAPLPVRPMLLAGWLRDRLARSAGGAFQVRVSAVAGEGPIGRILGVRFDMTVGSSIWIGMEPGALVISHPGVDPIRIPRPIEPEDELLCRVIERREHDAGFVRALRMAAATDAAGVRS